MMIHRVLPEDTGTLRVRSMPNSAKYRRYAEVARKLAMQQQGSDDFMWAQLAQLWDRVADRKAAQEAQSAGGKHQLLIRDMLNDPAGRDFVAAPA